MLIKSNFKDYYDFLQGKYGIDPLVTYDRVCSTQEAKTTWWKKSGLYKPKFIEDKSIAYDFQMIAVAGTIYCVYYYCGKFYFGSECEGIAFGAKGLPPLISLQDVTRHKHFSVCHGMKTDINEKENCPVLLVRPNHTWRYALLEGESELVEAKYEADIKNPRLSDYQFGKCLDAEKCYLAISGFLSREKPVKDTRTDIQKVISKGFDQKYSFRNRPKKTT